jgi:beta-lactamase regulating signal transducer with metallopeptidase domain
MIESGLRALVFALVVWAGLRAFGVKNVVALKAAWGAVLCAALAMPLLMSAVASWNWMPTNFVVVLPEQAAHWSQSMWTGLRHAATTETRTQQEALHPAAKVSDAELAEFNAQMSAANETLAKSAYQGAARQSQLIEEGNATQAAMSSGPNAALSVRPNAALAEATELHRFSLPKLTAVNVAWMLYAAIVLALLGRLLYGIAVAMQLRLLAKPVELKIARDLSLGLDLRTSGDVASPVTIGNTVILPEDFTSWSEEKLRIVLAHERSHIRQKDFYLQLAAGVYAALFWLSPLGWWLKRKLSDLAEAISDKAGLEEAVSRSSYAQVLLEFAAQPRPTRLGVAMARTGNLSRRMERLLNETNFSQAYSGTRARALAAMFLVPLALVAALATIHVRAAVRAQEPAPPAPPAVAAPDQPAPPQAATPSPAPAPDAREGVSTPPPELPTVNAGPMPAPQAAPAPPAPPAPGAAAPDPAAAPLPPPEPDQVLLLDDGDPMVATWDDENGGGKHIHVSRGMMIRRDDNGDSYILVRGDGPITVSGGKESEALQKARKMTKGDFLLYTHNGKSYVIDDPATIAKLESSFGPGRLMAFKFKSMRDQQMKWAAKQKEFAVKQKEFADKQRIFMVQRKELSDEEAAKILHSTDLQKQMADLNATINKLRAEDDKKLSEKDLAKVREQVAGLQAKLGAMQWHLDTMAMPKVDLEIPKIDIDTQVAQSMEIQAKVQAQIAQEQEKAMKERDQKMKSIIDQSIQNGLAKPVN